MEIFTFYKVSTFDFKFISNIKLEYIEKLSSKIEALTI